MSIFFTDLDNTMIYSHHREIVKPKIVVEHLDGKEQSFMTEFAYDFLSSTDWLEVVPVTTRTKQQYDRIECSERLRFKYAIVCNGGKLLVDGKEDLEWSGKTDALVRDNYESLEKTTELLSEICCSEIIHRPERYMSYVKCSDPEGVYKEISKSLDPNRVNVQRDGRKVYLFANGISKGEAIERFIRKRKAGTILSAGDNLMDVSMLNNADFAFVNKTITDLITCKNRITIEETPFSDGICRCIAEMRMKGRI